MRSDDYEEVSFAGGLPLSLLWVSCSEPPKPVAQKEPEKPAEPASGQSALYKMYQVARAAWSADAQVLKLNSIHLPDVPAEAGKAGAWQATFTSANLGKTRTYTYSVEEQEGNLHKGVFSLGEEPWSGRQGVNTAFDIRAVSIDSVAAYKTATKRRPTTTSNIRACRFPFYWRKPTSFRIRPGG